MKVTETTEMGTLGALSRSQQINLKKLNLEFLLSLQGELKIEALRPLKINWIKSVLIIIPMIISVIGLLLIKYFKQLRVLAFYSDASIQEATHIYIIGTDQIDSIQDINNLEANQSKCTFFFQKLKYQIIRDKAYPIGFSPKNIFQIFELKQHLQKGLDPRSIENQNKCYGRNQHLVDIPKYYQYLLDVMTQPFYLIQYLICVNLILQRYQAFAGLLFLGSLATVTVNYILTYLSFKKIKQIAEKPTTVNVLRSGKINKIDSGDLVPGDLFIPQEQITCDALILQGQVYVNQASLTGQSIPIGKYPITSQSSIEQTNRWLFEGSKVLECKDNTLAMVISTGYTTHRGRILRKILNRVAKAPDFFKTAIYFFIETFIVGLIVYLGTLPVMFTANISSLFIGYRLISVMAWSFPPIIPIYFNLAYSCSLGRLRCKNIIGTQPQKTVQSAKLKTVCFDKTGTLTQNLLQIYKILKFKDNGDHDDITKNNNRQNQLIFKLFSTCHTVRQINQQFLGDQVDLRMFLASQSKFVNINPLSKICFMVQDKFNNHIEVLRINQFQSKFQSMSVLVHDHIHKRLLVFLKGAPQKIQANSIKPIPRFDQIISGLSLSGYRTIAFGYKQIKLSQIDTYLTQNRQIFQHSIIPLGLIAFQNKLKQDAAPTISKLIQARIEPKIITGDHIYIGIQTAIRSGILKANQQVIILEGKKQQNEEKANRIFHGIILRKDGNEIIQQKIALKQNNQYLEINKSIAVDNDFINLTPQPLLVDNIKIYARISPENKAKIVRSLKIQINDQYNYRTCLQRFFGDTKMKIAMVGDGANDLMAIRQADVGLGINDSDASYAASFTISNLDSIDLIIRQSKCAQMNIIQIVRYYGITNFLAMIPAIILISDATYFSPAQLIFTNATSGLLFPFLMALSFPNDDITPHSPCSNFMGLQNHLVYWGNLLIPTLGFVGGGMYYFNTNEYLPNPNPVVSFGQGGYHTLCHSSTIYFLMNQVIYNLIGFMIYTSNPFKQKIWKNIPLFLVICINFALSIVFFFITSSLQTVFDMVIISNKQAGIVLAIVILSMIIGLVYNYFIQCLKLYKKNRQLSISPSILYSP